MLEGVMPLRTPPMCTIYVRPLCHDFRLAGQLQRNQPSSIFLAVSSPQWPFTVKVDPLNLVDANLDVGKPLFFISYLTFHT
jgi:hypothetical protein